MIKKLQAGDNSIPASGWNEMRAFIQDYSIPQDTFKSPPRNPAYIYVKNVTSAALPALSIVKISTPIYTRSGDTFKNKGIEYGVELEGDTPGSDSDNIAVIQEAIRPGCIGRAICSGATPCIIHKADDTAYKYAKPVTSQTGYMEGTDDVTNYRVLWIATGTGNKEAFIICDASGTPEPEYFIINYGKTASDTPTHTPTIFTKGSLHYIKYNSAGYWEPSAQNEAASSSTALQRPLGTKLVVCQIDAPNSAAECKIPYFTPESNMGVPPAFTSSISFFTSNRCGVKPGEHTFTDKYCDYSVTFNSGVNVGRGGDPEASASYEYNPQFTAIVTVDSSTTTAPGVFADICGNEWEVFFPDYNSGLSAANYPDIYQYDQILTLVDCENKCCYAIDYPTDYQSGDIIAFYGVAPGRGWTAVSTPQNLSGLGFTLYQKDKTNAIL